MSNNPPESWSQRELREHAYRANNRSAASPPAAVPAPTLAEMIAEVAWMAHKSDNPHLMKSAAATLRDVEKECGDFEQAAALLSGYGVDNVCALLSRLAEHAAPGT